MGITTLPLAFLAGLLSILSPWDGADTLEWTLPSPAPYHSFETPPVVK